MNNLKFGIIKYNIIKLEKINIKIKIIKKCNDYNLY